jgi:pectin methylesterase-like acyl-CoA thioesterase
MVDPHVGRGVRCRGAAGISVPLALAVLTACGSEMSEGNEGGSSESGAADAAFRDQAGPEVGGDAGRDATPPRTIGGADGSTMTSADAYPSDSAAANDSTTSDDSADAPAVMTVDSGTLNPDEGPLQGTNAMVFPPPGGQGVCPDPPLRITFASPPTLGSTGAIRVLDDSGAVVATVDMGATTYTDAIGGITFNLLRPVYVDGNDVVIYLPSHALGYGKTYSVTVDSGAILGPGGTSLVVSDSMSWRFSTATAAPITLSSITVATNSSGDFCSIQGALDAISGGAVATTITIQPGRYHEVIHTASQSNVTLHGVDRKTTIIDATNNNNMNPTTMTRSVVGIDNSSNLVIDNLTIQNSTPQGGSQAEALRLQGCDKCTVKNADIKSLQDTLLWSGRIYAENCYVAGNVDFVWGTGAAYFKNCEIRTLGRAVAIVQARNGSSGYGYVFVDSTLTADSTVSGQLLGRIDIGAYPYSHVAYINCTMGSFIAPAGWAITGVGDVSQLRFWEYQSTDATGNAIDTSQRIAGSTQISAAQAASMRDPSVVLSGWTP